MRLEWNDVLHLNNPNQSLDKYKQWCIQYSYAWSIHEKKGKQSYPGPIYTSTSVLVSRAPPQSNEKVMKMGGRGRYSPLACRGARCEVP